jgi:2-desacetyl-2-hydroxyethyl bacteriochlorophyllide A dehydrogenase
MRDSCRSILGGDVRAVVVTEPGTVAVERVEDPSPGRAEVVVEVEACGICGTDIHILDGEFAPTPYPIVPGHEFCGRVVGLGAGAEGLAEDDFVCVDPSLFCGACRFCRIGRGNLCERWNAIGVTTAGACAEFVAVPAANAFRLSADIPRRCGTLVEPLSCAVHGFDRLPARLADHYLVYGAGTMGLLLSQLARAAGAASVSVVDTNAARLPRARRIGADHAATSADELDRYDWEIVIDATGAVAAIEDGLRRVARGGTFQVFGVAAPEAEARFSPFQVYNEEINIVGSMAVLHSFERARDLLERGVIDAEAILTHRVGLDAYEDAIATFRAGEGLKIQVAPEA